MDPTFLSSLRAGNIDLLRELCEEDSTQLYRKTVKGNSILHIAASHDFLWPVIEEFPPASLYLLLHQNTNGDTWLHCAVRAGQDLTSRHFISSHDWWLIMGVLNERDDAPLHEAARCSNADAVRMLVEIRLDMAAVVNKDGESPVYLAAVKGSVEAVGILLGCGTVEYGGAEGKTALHAAVCQSYGDRRLRKKYLDYCMSLSANYVKSSVIAEMLLEKKPELNHQVDASQNAPIHYAASFGYVNMVRLLLQGDASVAYLLDIKGLSALHIAARMNYGDVIKEILHRCPDASEITDIKGNNFVHVAVKKRATKVLRLVLGNLLFRRSLNETDHGGNTPLHLAVMKRNWKIVNLLLSDSKVERNVTNRNGFTPLDIASSSANSKPSFQAFEILSKFASVGSKFGPHRKDLIMGKRQPLMTDEVLERFKAVENNMGLVAVLIATVTFAAAFTLPGGYVNDGSNQEEGTAILAKKLAFKIFLISDTIAMASSVCIALLLIFSARRGKLKMKTLLIAEPLLGIALVGMLVAFSMGIHVVLVSKSKWLAILISGISICYPVIVFLLLILLFKSRIIRML